MPYSDPVLDDVSRQLVSGINLHRCLDIGAGAGKYGKLVRKLHPHAYVAAVEIESDYIKAYALHDIYNIVWCMSADDLFNHSLDEEYDLVVIGDCLEHMRKSQGVDLLNFLVYRVKYMLVLYPIRYIQGAWNGYRSEAHISVWNEYDFSWLDHIMIRREQMVAIAADGYLRDPNNDISVQLILQNVR